ncbi:MAG TPA: glycoside hydrolase family 15 protein, partial [Thermomicrobiaceae bacterium]|nr:glycoside hydrolase family 15 protein [Thermomicrobiaceae bacterium]
MSDTEMAPGAPGIPPAWTSSAKDAVATGLGSSHVWITIGRGVLNEVYWPRLDSPQIRDLGFIVADGEGYWDEVKRDSHYDLQVPEPGIPAYQAVHHADRYTLSLDFLPDPDRDVVLIKAHLDGDERLKLYPLLAPHLDNTGSDNTAWVESFRDWDVLFAQRESDCLALCIAGPDSESAVSRAGAGFVGASDGWQDFDQNGRMTWTYPRAENGNVALMAEVPSHDCLLALGFGDTPELAATAALASLHIPFDSIHTRYVTNWRSWQSSCKIPASMDPDVHNIARISATVLKTHIGRIIPGAMVASLSIPWGQSRDDLGGYHLIWSRDLVESAGGLLVFGAADDARLVLSYLIASQQADGHWAQNQWLDGRPYWTGIQMDEAGFPILLAQALDERGELAGMPVKPMIERAAAYLAQNGPVTQQDRWEEDPGLSPFTVAVEVAALVAAAGFLEEPARSYVLELADSWNSRIEDWTYTTDGNLAKEHGLDDVDGYYVRIAPPEAIDGEGAGGGVIAIKNRPPSSSSGKTSEFISLEFLELVRLGLRRAADPGIVNTVKLIDAVLKVDTPSGAAWHRYNDDGYGEHQDGSPFDGTGIGR